MKLTNEILTRLINEEIERQDKVNGKELLDKSKFIPIEDEKEQYTAIQRKYLDIISGLEPDELKQIKAMFCFDRYSVDQLNSIGLAQKGKLKEK